MNLKRKARNPAGAREEPGLVGARLMGVIVGAVVLVTAIATPPEWWADRGVLDSEQNPNNRAAVTVGQIKNFAVQAKAEMDEKFADQGGAGPLIDAMVASWHDANGNPKVTDNQYAAATVGQLKAVGTPFYDRLSEVGLRAAGTYPWTNSAPAGENYAVANAGQVKNVFAFEIPSLQITLTAISGNNQNGHKGEVLELPLRVKCLAGAQAIAGRAVHFGVPTIGGAPIHSGLLRAPQSLSWLQAAVVMTDADGYAEVLMKLPGDLEGPYTAAIEASLVDPALTATFVCNVVPLVVPPTGLAAVVRADGAVELTWERGAGDNGSGYIVEKRFLHQNGSAGNWNDVVNSWLYHSPSFRVRADDPYYLDADPCTGRIPASAIGFEYRVKSIGAAVSEPCSSVSVTWNTDGDAIPDWVEWMIIRYKHRQGDPAATSLAYVTNTTKRLTGTGQTDKVLWELGQLGSQIGATKLSHPLYALRGTYGYREVETSSIFYSHLLGDTGFGFEGYVDGIVKFTLDSSYSSGGSVRTDPEATPSSDHATGTTSVVTEDIDEDGVYTQHDLVEVYCELFLPETAKQTVVMRATVANPNLVGANAEESFFVYRTHAADSPPVDPLTFGLSRESAEIAEAEIQAIFGQPFRVRCVASTPAEQAQAAGKIIRFSVESGTALLSSSGNANGPWRTWVDVATDAEGYAQAWGKAPSIPGTNSPVTAKIVSGGTNQAGFTAKSEPLPAAPSLLSWSIGSDGRVILTWQDQSVNETGFVLQRAEKKAGSQPSLWADATVTAAGVVTWTDMVPASSPPTASTEGFAYRIAANGVHGSSSWQQCLATWDTDTDGLPDWFERRIVNADADDEIGDVAAVLSGDDYDGDGMDNRQEWLDGTDPAELVQGIRLLKVAGDLQQDLYQGSVLPEALEVEVFENGSPLAGISVQFAPQNGSRIGVSEDSVVAQPVTIVTDAEGRAKAYCQAPVTQGQSAGDTALHLATASVVPVAGSSVSQKFHGRLQLLRNVLSIEDGDRQSRGPEPIALVVKLTDPFSGAAVPNKTIRFSATSGDGTFHTLQGGAWQSTSAINVDAVTTSDGHAVIRYHPAADKFQVVVSATLSDGVNSWNNPTVRFTLNPAEDAKIVASYTVSPSGPRPAGQFTTVQLNLKRAGISLKERLVTFRVFSGNGGLSSAASGENIHALSQEFVTATDTGGNAKVSFQHPIYEAASGGGNHQSILHAKVSGGDLSEQGEEVFYPISLTTTPEVPAATPGADVLLGNSRPQSRQTLPVAVLSKKANVMCFADRKLVLCESNGSNRALRTYRRGAATSTWTVHETLEETLSIDRLAYDHAKGRLMAVESTSGIVQKYALDSPSGALVKVEEILEAAGSLAPGSMDGELPLGAITAVGGDLFAVSESFWTVHRLAEGAEEWTLFDSPDGVGFPAAVRLAGHGRHLVRGMPRYQSQNVPGTPQSVDVYFQRSGGAWGKSSATEKWDSRVSGYGDFPGTSVAVSDEYLVIGGSPLSSELGGATPDLEPWQKGGATIYERVSGMWNFVQHVPLLDGYRDGRVKVAIDGDRVAIAAYGAHPYLNTDAGDMDGDDTRGSPTGTAPDEGTPVERVFAAVYSRNAEGLFAIDEVFVDQESLHLQSGDSTVTAGRYRMELGMADGIVALSFPKQEGGKVYLYEDIAEVSEAVSPGSPILSFRASNLYPLASGSENVVLETTNAKFAVEPVPGTDAWNLVVAEGASLDSFAYEEGANPEESVIIRAKLANVILEQREFRVAIKDAPLEAPSSLLAVNSGETVHQLTWQDHAIHETGFEIDRRYYPSAPAGELWSSWSVLGSTVAAHSGTGEVSHVVTKPSGVEVVEYRVRAIKTNAHNTRRSASSEVSRVGVNPLAGPPDQDLDGIPDSVEDAEGSNRESAGSNSRDVIGLIVRTPLKADP